jgi:hypothetical protein
MTLSLGRTISTLALAAGRALGTAGTAAAQTLTVKDARGDVQAFDAESETTTPAPGVRNSDVLRTTFRHEDRRISVRAKLTELSRSGQASLHGISLVTNEKVRRDVTIYATKNMWRGQAEMSRPNGTPVACDIAHKIDYANNVVTLSFPRSCVSDPRWVRVGFASVWMKSNMRAFGDDAQLSGRINDRGLKLSDRLRRG